MPVYHIVLFKLKPGITATQVSNLKVAICGMVGQIPGLTRVDFNPPLPVTAHRAKGYDLGLVAVLEKPEDVAVYGGHDAHLKVHKMREEMCSDTLAYDMEF